MARNTTAAKAARSDDGTTKFTIYVDGPLLKRFRKTIIDRNTQPRTAIEESLRLWLSAADGRRRVDHNA